MDLAQSAIGPGMGVYSRYGRVLEADGSAMTVRSALQIINQELDVYFNEQDGELDANSRFCVDLYTQNAFNNLKFGDADTLARAKNDKLRPNPERVEQQLFRAERCCGQFVARVLLFPVVLLSAFLVLMLKWTLNLSAFVLALTMCLTRTLPRRCAGRLHCKHNRSLRNVCRNEALRFLMRLSRNR